MNDQLENQRTRIRDLLAGGLDTHWRQRAYSDNERLPVVQALQLLTADDVENKLRIAGFLPTPYVGAEDPGIEQSCSTCMYFDAHQRHCTLPELMLAVEPEWSCILWRI